MDDVVNLSVGHQYDVGAVLQAQDLALIDQIDCDFNISIIQKGYVLAASFAQ